MSDRAATCPILVVWDSGTTHRFSGYITEILDVEGYNWRAVHNLASDPLTAEILARHQIVILTHIEPSQEVQELLLAHVRGGGNLSRSASTARDGRQAGARVVVCREDDGRPVYRAERELRRQRRGRALRAAVPTAAPSSTHGPAAHRPSWPTWRRSGTTLRRIPP